MENDREHLDAVERALVELRAAERAGVYQPTRVRAPALMRSGVAGGTMSPRRLVTRLLGVAAVLMLGVTAWLLQYELGRLNVQRNSPVAIVAPDSSESMRFADCMSGPSAPDVPEACRQHDHNGDGSVDLRDYGVLQLASARAVP